MTANLSLSVGDRLLLALAHRIRRVPPDQFNMQTVIDAGWSGKLDVDGCFPAGISACAMGWAVTMPAFKARGLSVAVFGGSFQPQLRLQGYSNDTSLFDMACILFGITRADSERLFGSNRRTAKEQAEVICRFVGGGVARDIKEHRTTVRSWVEWVRS